jgi:23S rRNA (uracil1939-C5)-methyltransferase
MMSASSPLPSTICDHLTLCSGCPHLGVPYERQLQIKHARVVAALSRYDDLHDIHVEPVLGSDLQLGYRTRAKLMVAPGGKIGLYARDRDHQVVDIPGCKVLTPLVARVVAGLRAMLTAGSLGLTAGRELVAIDVREAETDEGARVLLTLVVRRDRRPSEAKLREAGSRVMAAIEQVQGVAVNLRERGSVQVLGAQTWLVAGVGMVPDRLGGTYHHATFGAFTQVHRHQAARVHELVAGAIGATVGAIEGKRVLELYGGAGALGLGLVRRGAHVSMIESFAPAVDRAVQAAREQGFEGRYQAVAGDAAVAAKRLGDAKARFDVVVVNPPRRGMAPEVRQRIAGVGAKAIGYVSCDPDTLARDLADLARRGYRTSAVQPLDMIPQTDQVECFAWLVRGEPVAPRVLVRAPRLMAVACAAHDQNGAKGAGRWRSVLRHEWEVVTADHEHDLSGMAICVASGDTDAAAALTADPESSEVFVVLCVGRVPSRGRRGLAWRRLAMMGGHSLVWVERRGMAGGPVTQALSRAGLRVVGDKRWGHAGTNAYFEERFGLDRPFAHRYLVRLGGGSVSSLPVQAIRSPLAGDLVAVLARLGGLDPREQPVVRVLM